jgi:hypothetical protein
MGTGSLMESRETKLQQRAPCRVCHYCRDQKGLYTHSPRWETEAAVASQARPHSLDICECPPILSTFPAPAFLSALSFPLLDFTPVLILPSLQQVPVHTQNQALECTIPSAKGPHWVGGVFPGSPGIYKCCPTSVTASGRLGVGGRNDKMTTELGLSECSLHCPGMPPLPAHSNVRSVFLCVLPYLQAVLWFLFLLPLPHPCWPHPSDSISSFSSHFLLHPRNAAPLFLWKEKKKGSVGEEAGSRRQPRQNAWASCHI